MRSEHLAYHRPVLKVGSISLRPCRSSQCLGKDGEAANLGATLDHSRGLPNCTCNRNCSGALRNCDCKKCQHKSRCQDQQRRSCSWVPGELWRGQSLQGQRPPQILRKAI